MDCSNYLLDFDFSEGDPDCDGELVNRFYRESVYFMRELQEIGRNAAIEWFKTASFNDMMYVRAISYCDWWLDNMKDDPVIWPFLLSVLSRHPLLDHLIRNPPGTSDNSDIIKCYTSIIAVSWFDAFNEQWDMCSDKTFGCAIEDFYGTDADCNQCGRKDSCQKLQEQIESKKDRLQKTRAKGRKSKASTTSA